MTAPRTTPDNDEFDRWKAERARRAKLPPVPDEDEFERWKASKGHEPKKNDPTLLDQTKEFVTDVARGLGHFATHPWELVTTPAREATDALFTPVEGSESSGIGGRGGPARLPQGTKITKENTPGAITAEEQRRAAREALVDVPLLAAGGSKLLYPLLAGSGAVHNPEHPVKGALEMVAGAGVVHGALQIPKVADVSSGMVEAGVKDLARDVASEQSHAESGMSPRRRPAPPPPIEPAPGAEGVSVGETPARELGPVGRSAATWLDVPKSAIGDPRRRPAAPPPVPQVTPDQVAAQLHPQTPSDVAARIAQSANENAAARAQSAGRRELSGEEFGGAETPTAALREHARAFAYANLRGREFTNAETEISTRVNRRGIDHTLRRATDSPEGRTHAQSMAALDQLLEDATYVGSEANRDPRQAASLKAVHRYEKPLTIGGKRFNAKLVIKETPDGHFFYDHHLTKLEPVAPSDEPFHRMPRGQDGGDAGNATGSSSDEPPNNTAPDETAHYPPQAELEPVASANSDFLTRPGTMRKVNAGQPALPSPLRLPPEPTTVDRAQVQPEGVTRISPEEVAARKAEPAPLLERSSTEQPTRGRKAPDLFDEARSKNGDLRPFHRVSDDGLLRELNEYQAKIVDAQQRAQYNWRQDENFHSTEDGRAVASATRRGGKGASEQAKALQNLKDYDRIMNEIEAELHKRGHTRETIYERQQHLGDLDAALERDAIERANNELDADTAFDIGDEPLPGAAPVTETTKAAPDHIAEPREYLNYAKFGLDQTNEARVRGAVERGRADGSIDKGHKTFEEQRAEAAAFAKKLIANPLDIDQAKLKDLSGAEIVGLHSVVGENTRAMEAASRVINDPTSAIAEIEGAQTLFDQASKSTDQALQAIVREKAETARGLGFLRQVAKQSTDPEVWLVHAKKLLGDKPLPDSVMLEIRRLAREATEACGGAS